MNDTNPLLANPVPPAMQRSPILRIELNRVEGVLATWKAMSFAGANRVLSEWAETAPAAGGYDKVQVTLTWANGIQHDYRLDLQHPLQGEAPDVCADLKHFVAFCHGEAPNPNWTDAQHARVLKRYEEQGVVAQAKTLRAHCMLTDF